MFKIEKRKWYHQIGIGLVEMLFPSVELCPVCHQEERYRQGIGKSCLRQVAIVTAPICSKCGRPQRLNAANESLCEQCRETRYYFSAARSVAIYEGALREYLAELKYRYRPDLGDALGILLLEWARLHRDYLQKIDWILSIPIHPEKLGVRGYNQSELLARPLRNYLGKHTPNEILIRDKITESQNVLTKEERFRNISGAFRVVDASRLSGSTVLLIDDILTTGATVSEAARVLLRAGANEVKVLTLATGALDLLWFDSLQNNT